jgi:hypothetical protein
MRSRLVRPHGREKCAAVWQFLAICSLFVTTSFPLSAAGSGRRAHTLGEARTGVWHNSRAARLRAGAFVAWRPALLRRGCCTHRRALHHEVSTLATRPDAEAWLTGEGPGRLISAGAWPPASRMRATELADLERRLPPSTAYSRGWLAGRHDLRGTMCASYRTALERLHVPSFGDTPLTDITPSLVRSWFQSDGDRTPTARARLTPPRRRHSLARAG